MLAQTALTLDHLVQGPLHPRPRLGRDWRTPCPTVSTSRSRSAASRRRSRSSGCCGTATARSTSTGEFYHLRACAPGHRTLRRALSADLDRRQPAADARHHRPPCRRLVARGRVHAGGLRREARRSSASAAERAGRDPMAIVPAITQICLIGDDDEIAEMLEAPLVKAIMLHADRRRLAQVRLRASDGAGLARISWTSIPSNCPARRSSSSATRSTPRRFCDIIPVRHTKTGGPAE